MWRIEDQQAFAESDRVRAQIDLRFPQRGLHDLVIDGYKLAGATILGSAFDNPDSVEPEPVLDRYIRGNDLVVTYEQSGQRTNQTQLYWRILTDESTIGESTIGGFELIYSLQTSLIEAQPIALICSTVPTDSIIFLTNRATGEFGELDLSSNANSSTAVENDSVTVFRSTDCDFSYVETTDTAENCRTEISRAAANKTFAKLTRVIHAPRLEKGVIRRGRVRGQFVPRQNDERAALACFEELSRAALPLTT